MLKFLTLGTVACCTLVLVSCGAPRNEAEPRGTAAQNILVSDLIMKAGLSQPPAPGDAHWATVAEAGIYEIERQCDQYLEGLARFPAASSASSGNATITIMAAALGLSPSLYDVSSTSILYTIEPSARRTIVRKRLTDYIDNIDLAKVTSRPRLMIALQGYLSQCSAAAIEANAGQANSQTASGGPPEPSASAARAAALAAPASTFIERSAVVVAQRVEPTPSAPADDLARNRKPSEVAVTKRTLIAAQKALGIAADGNFGVAGDSETRPAIRQFQLGRNRRDPAQWPLGDVTGELSGRTGELLPFLAPVSPVFQTPFERALLGNDDGALGQRLARASPAQLSALLDMMKVSDFQVAADSPPALIAARMKDLRGRLAELRRARAIDPDKGGVLDADLYDSLIDRPP